MTPFDQQVARAWHAEPVEAVFAAWSATASGLSQAEVERRQKTYGPNLLPERGATPVWRIVLRQFASPLIYILVAAAVVSASIGDLKDAAFIAAVLVLNAVIQLRCLVCQTLSHPLNPGFWRPWPTLWPPQTRKQCGTP